ncbi:MAG TPA: FAD-dependent oxidoreductase [Puia sp.]|jgi:glycine/D-amino acid oxidase-like deaminating enzyme|nr:FAD-dependent oxidoreductase [Puia sp.]
MAQLSVWEKESFFAPADIVIAGSGLVGLWSAYYLKKHAPSLSITIIERGLIPTGASTRNAGFACFGSLSELVSDAGQMGMDQLLELVDMRYRGLKRIRKTFSAEDITYEKYGGYELIGNFPASPPSANAATSSAADTSTSAAPSSAPDLSDLDQLRSSIDEFNRILKKITGFQKTFRLKNENIAQFGFSNIQYLIENRSEGQLHPGKLCQALLRLVQSIGVTVLNNIEITSFEKVSGHLLIHTQHPFPLIAQQLLVATNAFAQQLLPQLDITPARGQVLVTSPIDGLPFKGTFHFDKGFYYFRNLGDRVLLGGARNMAIEAETTTEMGLTDLIQHELERFLQEVVLPDRFYTIEHRWSGIMGMGSEKMPIIKAVNDHIFCAVRMSGMGVALAPVVGEKIALLMTGGAEPAS